MTPSLVPELAKQYMPCSDNFSMTFQTEILATETSVLFKQIIILKLFNPLLNMKCFGDEVFLVGFINNMPISDE